MKRSFITATLLSVLFCTGFAKTTGTVKGEILDENNQPVAYVNVALRLAADSSIAKVELTLEDGTYRFVNVSSNDYFVEASFVGLATYSTEIFSVSDGGVYEVPQIQMTAQENQLEEVTVTAQKPLLELKPGKMVLNVQNSVTGAGDNALDLLRKSPGVVIDNNENISLLGKAGVQVYIDDKISPLSGTDLAAFLKTVQASEIEAIEIITNPSAKYDAQGNAGIINIKMKRDERLGANANLNLGYSQGEVARYNGGISGNYKNKAFNTFGSYSYNNGNNVNFNEFSREQFGFTFEQVADQANSWESNNYRLGTDFFVGEKHTIGFLVNGFISNSLNDSDSRAVIGTLGENSIDSVLIAGSNTEFDRRNNNFNINYKFDSKDGKTLNIDADYGLFRIDGEDFQPNAYYDPTESVILSENNVFMNMPTDIDIATFKVDYEQPLWKGQLGAGIKTSYVTTDNTFNFFNVVNGENILNRDVTNQFEYTENVNAAYANYSQKIDKFSINAGLRLEQTNSEGDLTSFVQTDDENVKRNYLDLFPSAGISYTMNEKHSFQLNYSRRINRPNYQDLNPFRMRLDELTFEKGNPFLQPEYTNRVSFTHSFMYALNTTFSFDYTSNLIARLTDAETEKSAFITYRNVADQFNYSLNVSGALPITEWWSTYTSLTGFYQENRADFGDGKTLDLNVTSFNVYSQQTLRLPKDFAVEISGWYSSPQLWEGSFEMDAMWQLNAGISKKVLDGRGNLKLAINDIFKTQVWSGVSEFGDLIIDVRGGWDSRRVNLNFSYMLGNTNVKSRRRKTGLEDESGRVKSGS